MKFRLITFSGVAGAMGAMALAAIAQPAAPHQQQQSPPPPPPVTGSSRSVHSSRDAAPPPNFIPRRPSSPDDPRFAKFVYDVVSVKPFKPDQQGRGSWIGIQDSPDGTELHNMPLLAMIGIAFKTAHSQPKGGPDWADRDRFEINAKMDPEVAEAFSKLSIPDQKIARQHMLQVLMRDYFKVQIHMETTEAPIFTLTIAKSGSKLKEVTDPNVEPGGINISFANNTQTWVGHAAPISVTLGQMSGAAGRPVYDETGLTGLYDFTFKFTPNREDLSANPNAGASTPPVDAAPPLDKALEEQLGLKLTPGKGPMDVIVVDHAERPAMN
jgi:uncharacterized protein (TIGR03435 family)